jgi:hypothetical protein
MIIIDNYSISLLFFRLKTLISPSPFALAKRLKIVASDSILLVRVVIYFFNVRAGIANLAHVDPTFGTMNKGTSGRRTPTKLRASERLRFAADETLVTRPSEDCQPTAKRWPA